MATGWQTPQSWHRAEEVHKPLLRRGPPWRDPQAGQQAAWGGEGFEDEPWQSAEQVHRQLQGYQEQQASWPNTPAPSWGWVPMHQQAGDLSNSWHHQQDPSNVVWGRAPGPLPWTGCPQQHPLVQEQVPVPVLEPKAKNEEMPQEPLPVLGLKPQNQGMPGQTEQVEVSKEQFARAVLVYQQADDKAKLMLLTDPKTQQVMLEVAKFFMA